MSSTSTSITEALRKIEQLFSDAKIPSPRLDAEVLLAHVLGVNRVWLVTHGEDELGSEKVGKLESLVKRRLKREPVAYITGIKEFYGREFTVTPDVLIPRPETEALVELALEVLEGRRIKEEGRESQDTNKQAALVSAATTSFSEDSRNLTLEASEPDTTFAIHLQPESALLHAQGKPGAKPWSGSMYPESGGKRKVLDVGCGSGCIGITLKLERPELDVTLCDISPKALHIAQKNAKKLSANVHFAESDLLSTFLPPKIQNPKSKIYFDVIVANLPYVDASWETSPETAHEPQLALYADDGGLRLVKKLVEQSAQVLQPHGYLLLEVDPEQHRDTIRFAQANGFSLVEIREYAVCFEKVMTEKQ